MGGSGMKPGVGGPGQRPPFIPHVPFDLVLAEPAFPVVEQPNAEFEDAFQAVRFANFATFSRFLPLFTFVVFRRY